MNIGEIKEKLTSLADEYHQRDLSDPQIWKLDPEGFLLGWDALELIATYAVVHKVSAPDFDQEKIQKIYNSINEDAKVFLWQNYLSKYIKSNFKPDDKRLDAGFREIVWHYIEEFG